MKYQQVYQDAIQQPEKVWGVAAKELHWDKPYDKLLDDSNPPFYRWFSNGQLNTCYNAVDRHVLNGRADQAAIIYDSPVSNTVSTTTYRELHNLVSKFAGVLTS